MLYEVASDDFTMKKKGIIDLPGGTLGSDHAESLYRHLERTLADTSQAPLRVNCESIGFVHPAGVIGLITAARIWHRTRKRKVLLENLQPQVHAYLERIDIFKECAEFIETTSDLNDTDRFSRSAASSTVLEVTPISGEVDENARDVEHTIARTRKILSVHYGADHSRLHELLNLTSELAQNVVHSGDHGYITAQGYSYTNGNRVALAISDTGIGIEQSLRDSHASSRAWKGTPATGSDHILLALEEGVTSLPASRGMGLYIVRSIVQQWRGTLVIRSASSKVRIQHPFIAKEDHLPYIPGTQVTITARGKYSDGVLASQP